MITYQYKAITADGQKVRGITQAVDEFAAVEKIKETCPVITKITPVKEKGLMALLQMDVGPVKINTKALSIMCSQFAIILKSGVPISRCMEMIGEQTQDKRLKKMLLSAAEDVEQGNGVARSLEKNCKGLPLTFIETIRAGEHSGTLERSFETLEKYYEKSYKVNQKVRRALSYPIFVVCVAIVVLIIVMAKVVPTLAQTFADLGGELPLITRMLITMSDFFAKWWLLIIGIMIALIIGLKLLFNTEKGRVFWNKVKLKLPVYGNIETLGGAGQFANTMAALMTAGLSVHNALEITAKVMDNYMLNLEVSMMSGRIEEGRRLGECMRQSKYFPKTLVEMSAIGEDTGELEETLETTGAYFDNEAQHATEQAIAKLEPTIMIAMALFAGFIVIAIYLPTFTYAELI